MEIFKNFAKAAALVGLRGGGAISLKIERMRESHPRHADIADEAIALFQSGMSVKAIASRFNVARHVITRHLKIAGITPRNRSESMYLRMSQTNSDERVALTRASHAARKAMLTPEEWGIRQALAKQTNLSKVGDGEKLFIQWLSERGVVNCIPQQAVGKYNLDIGVAPIAVEIHETAKSDPSPVGQYRVIRGSGQFVAQGRGDLN